MLHNRQKSFSKKHTYLPHLQSLNSQKHDLRDQPIRHIDTSTANIRKSLAHHKNKENVIEQKGKAATQSHFTVQPKEYTDFNFRDKVPPKNSTKGFRLEEAKAGIVIQKIYNLQRVQNSSSMQRVKQFSVATDQEEDETVPSLQQYQRLKLTKHLKDLAELGSDLNRLKNDQIQSKCNMMKMKMKIKKSNRKEKSLTPQNMSQNLQSESDCPDINIKLRNNNFLLQSLEQQKAFPEALSNSDYHSSHFKSGAKNPGPADAAYQKQISALQERMRQSCKGDGGFLNMNKVFSCLNALQKEDDPVAFEPEIITNMRLRQQREEIMKMNAQQASYVDRTLFDFDDDIDQLSEIVDNRYGCDIKDEPLEQGPISVPLAEQQQQQQEEVKCLQEELIKEEEEGRRVRRTKTEKKRKQRKSASRKGEFFTRNQEVAATAKRVLPSNRYVHSAAQVAKVGNEGVNPLSQYKQAFENLRKDSEGLKPSSSGRKLFKHVRERIKEQRRQEEEVVEGIYSDGFNVVKYSELNKGDALKEKIKNSPYNFQYKRPGYMHSLEQFRKRPFPKSSYSQTRVQQREMQQKEGAQGEKEGPRMTFVNEWRRILDQKAQEYRVRMQGTMNKTMEEVSKTYQQNMSSFLHGPANASHAHDFHTNSDRYAPVPPFSHMNSTGANFYLPGKEPLLSCYKSTGKVKHELFI